ncbi:MAG: hypothetical protein H7288_05750 [Kineosporiaceae bacterium]|nr:hypothetical protein [Aeromicrobium sp.]
MSVTTKPTSKASTILSGRSTDDRGLRDRPRRAGQLALAGLLIAGSAVASAVLINRAGDTQQVLAARSSIAKGHTIARGDLVTKDVAGITDTFNINAAASLVGTTAVVDLVPGQVLTASMVSKTPSPGRGESIVGLNLDPSRVPSAGLDPGDTVAVIAVTGGDVGASSEEIDAPPVLASNARVFDVQGSATEGGGVLVTLVVQDSAAARIAAYSTAQRIAIVETASDPDGDASP